MFFFASVPIKAKTITCLCAVPTEHLKVIFVRLGGIEAAALVLATKAASAFIKVSALAHHPVMHKILTQLLAEFVRLPEWVFFVQAFAVCLRQVPRRIRM